MTRHYPDLGSASDGRARRKFDSTHRSTTQTLFAEETSGSVAKYRLFSHADQIAKDGRNNDTFMFLSHQWSLFLLSSEEQRKMCSEFRVPNVAI